MKQRFISVLLVLSMVLCLFTACGSSEETGGSGGSQNQSVSTDSNERVNENQKEEQKIELKDTEKEDKEAVRESNNVEVKNFPDAVAAFKETYNTFYDEHRMNGDYLKPEYDCFANVYILDNTPTMLIMDIIHADDMGSSIVDFYTFEYKDKEVKEKSRYSSIPLNDYSVFVYPLQEKLYVGYYSAELDYYPKQFGDDPTELDYCPVELSDEGYRVAVLEEYFEDLAKEYYLVGIQPQKITDKKSFSDDELKEFGQLNKLSTLDELKMHVRGCESFYQGGEGKYIHYFFRTELGKDGCAGNAILFPGKANTSLSENGEIITVPIHSNMNYALVCYDEARVGLTGLSFLKYLDFLSASDVKNNLELMSYHSLYLESIGEFYRTYSWESGSNLEFPHAVRIWLGGHYYYVGISKKDNELYIQYEASDFGYSLDSIPDEIYGIEVTKPLIDYYKMIYDKLPIEEVWKYAEQAKIEYANSPESALDAYRNEYYYGKIPGAYSFAFVDLDDNNIPELIVGDGVSSILVYYYDGDKVVYGEAFPAEETKFYKGGYLIWSGGNMGSYYDNVYQYKDNMLSQVFDGGYGIDYDGSGEASYAVDGKMVSELVYYAELEKYTQSGRLNYESYQYIEDAYQAYCSSMNINN